MTRNKGFTIIEVIIVLAIVALLALVGWRVWDANQTTDGADQTDTTQTENVTPINTEEDLNTAEKQLDETNVEGSESQQLDTETSF